MYVHVAPVLPHSPAANVSEQSRLSMSVANLNVCIYRGASSRSGDQVTAFVLCSKVGRFSSSDSCNSSERLGVVSDSHPYLDPAPMVFVTIFSIASPQLSARVLAVSLLLSSPPRSYCRSTVICACFSGVTVTIISTTVILSLHSYLRVF
ncbi:hypothetical protein RRG08_013529 [Elysia crispata]|uniref:Uncharacterized protein n=1 Tax=Elysia crispata TaxID=231223 RepID=A0AAE0Y0L3_9GAST|nr:hypothetical protein RRG08_013529 [Elysia crispata]